jgi:hypothetical protein
MERLRIGDWGLAIDSTADGRLRLAIADGQPVKISHRQSQSAIRNPKI